MIQRKQTVFLLLAFVLAIVCLFMQAINLQSVCLFLSALISCVTVYMYKRRNLQSLMCVVNMLLLLVWYLLLAAIPSKDGVVVQLEWPAVLPGICIVLLFMARKGINDDEKLVRSLDRIR